MALKSELVLGSSVDAKLLGHVLRGDSHRHETSRCLFILEDFPAHVIGVLHVFHVGVGHGLDTTSDSHLDFTSSDRIGHSSHGLKTRGAQSVDALHAGRLRVPSQESRQARVRGAST